MTPRLKRVLDRLPTSKGAIVILSGGMDSTIAMRLAVEKYGAENISSLSFNYGQKQLIELERAKQSSLLLNVHHEIAEIPFLHKCAMGVSANVDPNIEMPTIEDVLGDPAPKTEVPYRNMLLLTHAVMFAQCRNTETIICGLQIHDNYSYWDTTTSFLNAMNQVIQLNRKFKPTIIAPFSDLSKTDEINLLLDLDNNVDLLQYTLTCYNPSDGKSCGNCPSCSERLKAFENLKIKDPIAYVE